MTKGYVWICSVLLLLVSCSSENDKQEEESHSTVFIEKKVSETGVDFSNQLTETNELNIVEYLYYYNGAGVAVGDINGDGLDDIYLAANQKADKLYLNKGNLQFEDVTQSAGISQLAEWSTGVSMDDVNNDGHIDIYVSQVAEYSEEGSHNKLYINSGDGTFTEQANEYGLDFKGYSTHSSFIDYDNDGDLDMYLLNHAVHSVRSYGTVDKRSEKDAMSGDLFFENKVNESGKFENVTKQSGIYNSPLGYGLAISVADVNGDGYTDVYIGNDFHENDYLYVNNGDKTFTERGEDYMAHTTQFSMGADIADINGDGLVDIYTTDMLPYKEDVLLKSAGEDSDQIKRIKNDLGYGLQYARNHMQLAQPNGKFIDVAYATQTFATDWSWSVLLQDFDNNTMTDAYITNGIVRRPNDMDYINFLNEYDNYNKGVSEKDRTEKLMKAMPSQPLANILFQQTTPLSFTDVNQSGVGSPTFSTGAAFSDLDHDGDLDVIVNNINGVASILENTANKKLKGITIYLSDNSKKSVKGTKVIAYFKGKKVIKEIQTSKGFLSSSTSDLHFGIGESGTIDSLHIYWSDGFFQKTEAIVDQKYISIEKEKTGFRRKLEVANTEQLSAEKLDFAHKENKYNDEDKEKLVPARMSAEGPSILVGDINEDGVEDIVLGGGRGQAAQLLIGQKRGRYKKQMVKAFETDAKYEDVSAAFIDFDGDGDQDIYMVSGGNDFNELNKLLEDRLYLNNGNGDFRRIPLSLPHTNGSVVAVSDFDKDGYEDIFVGARSIPGSYGLSPYSFILKNLEGKGIDIAGKVRYGMVTDAEWGDIDNDGDDDLVICGDWMPVSIIKNNDGDFINGTESYSLSTQKGYWNTVNIHDVNQDGKLDILAGNMGQNSKWNATTSKPIKLYVGDFDENGSSDPIIFHNYINRYIPFASLPKLTSSMPFFKKKFADFKSYATVSSLTDLLDTKANLVEKKEVTELRSMLYLQGDADFEVLPFPMPAQYGCIQDINVDADGNIYYICGDHNNVAEVGNTIGHTGGILKYGGTSEAGLEVVKQLNLPAGIDYIDIKKMRNGNTLITSNNDNLYLLRK